jgi:hypothetical protein
VSQEELETKRKVVEVEQLKKDLHHPREKEELEKRL